MSRVPKGYLGIDHQTLGGDIISVLETVNRPEFILGPELVAKLRPLQRSGWYPIAVLLDLLERLDQKLGAYHLKQVGWTIFGKYQAEDFKREVHSAEAAMRVLDWQYRTRNRGTSIGGWAVESFTATRAELIKTTPHHCQMEEGILEEVLRTLGVKASVTQSQCFRKGADCCHFVLEPRGSTDRWMAR